jgi:hypothetical protein
MGYHDLMELNMIEKSKKVIMKADYVTYYLIFIEDLAALMLLTHSIEILF